MRKQKLKTQAGYHWKKLFPTVFLCLIAFNQNVFSQEIPFITSPEKDQHNNISIYLMEKANEITNRSLKEIESLSDWEKAKDERYAQYLKSLGLIDVPFRDRPPLNVTVTGVIQKDGYRIEKLYYESLPSLYVPANLYIPDKIKKPRPGILYLCGHLESQKVGYQAYARKLAQLGFVCLIVETVHQGEVKGEHHGCYARGWFNWYSRGYTPAGVEVWNGIRGLDLLASRKEVDKERLGVTGRSGGGAQTWMLAAADKRVKVAAPSVGATTMNEQILTRTIDDHCDCMVPINTFGWDYQDIGALIVPRVLIIDQGDRDRLTNIEGVRKMVEGIHKIYNLYEVPENVTLVETHGGHGSTVASRKMLFSLLLEKLMGEKRDTANISDADFSEEANLSAEELEVYVDGAPKDDRSKTIQDSFIKLPNPPEIETRAQLDEYSARVVNYLRKYSFAAFPEKPGNLAPHHVFRSMDRDKFGNDVYSFVPEEGWRLRMDVRWKLNPKEKNPLLIVIASPGDEYGEAVDFGEEIPGNFNIAVVNLRGTEQSGWENGFQWHIRRASAWTGRTIASMQVYDLLRAIEFARKLDGVDPGRISIAARDGLGVVALYSALLDVNIETVALKNPPTSQDVPGNPDGSGPATEMLNCLRVTDVWQIPALIPDTDIFFTDRIPETYSWSNKLREKIGSKPFKRK